ncbi:MAG: SIS domain-containing protein [Synergistaceae bacterium]|nr:SIS domain-containing protein [Synergistaceae bacterium]
MHDRWGGGASGYPDIITSLAEIFTKVRYSRKQTYFIGNGGSAAIAVHMTADYFKRGRMRTLSLYDISLITCLANDYGYEYVFSKQIERLSETGDLLVAISSSGKSQNIINAIEAAKSIGVQVMSLTGFEPDNPVRKISDYSVYVPCNEYGPVESIHNLILQQVVDML